MSATMAWRLVTRATATAGVALAATGLILESILLYKMRRSAERFEAAPPAVDAEPPE